MVQDQLVEYISSQLKAGVSSDAVKAALAGAGWQMADVEDTLKKVQGASAGSASVSPAASVAAAASSAKPASSSGPQVIRVSDLVAGGSDGGGMTSAKTDAIMSKLSASSASSSSPSKTASSASPASSPSSAKVSPNSFASPASSSAAGMASTASPVKVKKSHPFAIESVLGLLAAIFAVAAVVLFFENRGLSSQISDLNSTSGSVSSQVSALQSQLDASTTALQSQVSAAGAKSAELALELSFYAVPPPGPATTTFTNALVGMVSGGSGKTYVIDTPDGAKITVSNSKDARVVNLLQPLVGASSTSKFSGNYLQGSEALTLTAVGDTPVVPPPAATTSTTSTAPSAGAATTTQAPMIPATGTAQ